MPTAADLIDAWAPVHRFRSAAPSQAFATLRLAESNGTGTCTVIYALLNWVKRAQVDAGERPGATTAESVESRKLKAENRELRRANEILKAASVFFAAELDRPHR